MKLIIAGYTAAPADTEKAAIYFDHLMQTPSADGLEFAWTGTQTPQVLAPIIQRLPAGWTITLNDIPATAKAAAANPLFGLASPDETGREQAMAMQREIAAAIRAMNDLAGRQVVSALHLHCAPGFDNRVRMPEASAYLRSLEQVVEMTHDGCMLLAEHCDAFVKEQTPAKGFLQLNEEIRVLKSLKDLPIGLHINWGRSMLELRSADRVIDHVREAAASKLMRAFTFSGSSGVKSDYGDAWADLHVPFADPIDARFGEASSGMTTTRASEVLPYIQDCEMVCVKTQWPKSKTDPVERAASVRSNFETALALMQRRH